MLLITELKESTFRLMSWFSKSPSQLRKDGCSITQNHIYKNQESDAQNYLKTHQSIARHEKGGKFYVWYDLEHDHDLNIDLERDFNFQLIFLLRKGVNFKKNIFHLHMTFNDLNNFILFKTIDCTRIQSSTLKKSILRLKKHILRP